MVKYYEYMGNKNDENHYGVWFGFEENINQYLLDNRDAKKSKSNSEYIVEIKNYIQYLNKIIDDGDKNEKYRIDLAKNIPLRSSYLFIVTGFDDNSKKINKNQSFKYGKRDAINVFGIEDYKEMVTKFTSLLKILESNNDDENVLDYKNFGIIIETNKKPKILSNLDLKTPYRQVFFTSGIYIDEIKKVHTKKENIEELKKRIFYFYGENNIEVCNINFISEVNKTKNNIKDILTLDENSHKRWSSSFYGVDELNKDIENGNILPLIAFKEDNKNSIDAHILLKKGIVKSLIDSSEINIRMNRKKRKDKKIINKINNFLNFGNISNKGLIALLNEITYGEYDKTVGVGEGYTLGEHTLMVLEQFDKIKIDYDEGTELFLNENYIKFMLLIHDIGKPRAVELGHRDKEHKYTSVIIKKILSKLDISKEKVHLITSLLEKDIIGGYIQDNYNIEETLYELKKVIKKSGINGKSFLDLYVLYFKSDTSSYTLNAEGGTEGLDYLFDFYNGEIEFSYLVNHKISLLYENI